MFGKRILLLVPHPDDEVVGCAATLARAQKEGAEIFALYLTHGCVARETMWPWERKDYEKHVARRRAEAEEVARFLGITPVGWMARPARHLWRELPAAYDEVRRAVEDHRIDQLWVPAYEGGNADHDGANAIGSRLATKMSVLEFAEYNFAGGVARSHEFPQPNGSEQTLILTPAAREKKRAALRLYPSEQKNLFYVKSERETFRPLAVYDYTGPPHEGVLWYTRFQWVPFRHPQVDFTKPADVSAAITDFLRQAQPIFAA